MVKLSKQMEIGGLDLPRPLTAVETVMPITEICPVPFTALHIILSWISAVLIWEPDTEQTSLSQSQTEKMTDCLSARTTSTYYARAYIGPT